ncbi:MAG TPA: ABC transporter substrate-binding protein [Streptosporangiaceae bacterium]|nr:ABC transporter substrate-binding protein [Streptosporangiaceae bacterium]
MDSRRWHRPVQAVTAATIAAVLASGCGPGGPPASRGLRGQRLEVAAVWSGVEQRNFERVLRAFTRRTGVTVRYTSAGYSVPVFLRARLAAHRLPDVAFLPQPGLLRRYAAGHLLVPLNRIAGAAVTANYNATWRRLGSVGTTLYGVWFKAANKSLIWYNEDVFERAGLVPPGSVDALVLLEHRLAGLGVPAFAVGGADGWTLADWFSNLYLRLAGPARYDLLAAHRIAWTDPSVTATLRLLARVLRPGVIAGGARGALRTSYAGSVQETFAPRPAAAMVFEGDFVAGIISGQTRARFDVDADAFGFPAAGRPAPTVVAGGDAAVLMRRSAAGEALIRFLASPQAAAIWAARGGFVSPNTSLGLSAYPDGISRPVARSLLEAGGNFRFSLSDLTPDGFGGTEGRGMRGILQQFLARRDVRGTAARLEQAARRAYPR